MVIFDVLILEGAYASSVALTVDIVAAAAALAEKVKITPPRCRVISHTGGDVALSNGMTVKTIVASRVGMKADSVLIVPGLGITSATQAALRLAKADALAAAKTLSRASKADATICASCSAVLLLHGAGLLHEKRVTTAWWLAPQLQQLSPRCKIDANRLLVTDGKLVTAGAALAQTDLMLHLLRERCGLKLADAVARTLLIDKRQSQAPFIVPAAYANGSALVAKLTARIEACLPSPPTMAKLAGEMCMSERTLARHVRAATGRNPLALLQSIRIHQTQALLENSRLSVEDIAARVGYRDATALRRLLKTTMQSTPRQIRQRNDLR
jgi:transcriptional regulator GlxA family with amidase domain